MKNVIFCFSGTGNSLRAARIIVSQLGCATIVSVKDGTVSDLAADADMVETGEEWLPKQSERSVKNVTAVFGAERRDG